MQDKLSKNCTELRNAMEGAGTDEKTLIRITVENSHKDRLKIRDHYKSLYGRDFMKDLKSELSGDFRTLMNGLYTDPVEYDADCLYKAIKGAGTDDNVLIEIICSRPGWYIKKIKDKYLEKYKAELEKDVIGDTSGDYQKILVALLTGGRKDNLYPDKDDCIRIANELYKAGEGKVGTNEEVFIKYFSTCSPAELAVVAREYHKISGKRNLLEAINSEFSYNIKKTLQAILYSQISPSEYFATKIRESIKGAGTDEKSLIRVVVSRCEVDMPVIKKFYKILYKSDMVEDVKSDVSGDFGKLLVAIISKN